jgi:DNA-binding CsgD family transcriptional regulator
VALANARPHRRERVQAEERRIANLTDAERRVADLVAQGLSNRQVANRVFLSPHTVALHLRHIFWKLGVTSRVQLARMAAEQGSLIGDGNMPSLGSSTLICASWRDRCP